MGIHHPNYDHTSADMDRPGHVFNTMFLSYHERIPVPNDEPPYYLRPYPTMSLDEPYQSALYENYGISSMNNQPDINSSSRSFSNPETKEKMHDPESYFRGSANLDGHDDQFAISPSMFEQLHGENAALAGEAVDELSPAAFESLFSTSEYLEVPFQYQQTVSGNTYNDPISISASPTATSAEPSPQAGANLDVEAVIGTISLNGDILCHHSTCRRTFGRFAELKRHYTTVHATQKPEFWCNMPTCARSMLGGRPFHRKDKLRDHGRKMHQRGALRIGKR